MIVSLIAALDRRRGIGKDNQLPWRLPADLKRFRELTTGHHIIAGRITFESIGQPLPNRTTIIVTRNRDYAAARRSAECFVVHSLEAALALARSRGEQEVFVIGGAEIYAQALPHADRLYLTWVNAEVKADAFFPAFEESEWKVLEEVPLAADEKNEFATIYRVLQRYMLANNSPTVSVAVPTLPTTTPAA